MNDEMATRLRQARIRAGYKTLAAAVRAKGWVYSTIAGHENGTATIPLQWIEKYALEYGVSYDWLRSGEGDTVLTKLQQLSNTTIPTVQVPIISATDLSVLRQIRHKKMIQSARSVAFSSAKPKPSRVFAIEVIDRAMTRSDRLSINPGDFVHIDPDEVVAPGNIVVAVVSGYSAALIRKMERRSEGGRVVTALTPYNLAYETILFEADTDSFIVGKVIQIVLNNPDL